MCIEWSKALCTLGATILVQDWKGIMANSDYSIRWYLQSQSLWSRIECDWPLGKQNLACGWKSISKSALRLKDSQKQGNMVTFWRWHYPRYSELGNRCEVGGWRWSPKDAIGFACSCGMQAEYGVDSRVSVMRASSLDCLDDDWDVKVWR